jgi:hypothetical protein
LPNRHIGREANQRRNVSDSQHRVSGLGIIHSMREIARLFCAYAPVIGLIILKWVEPISKSFEEDNEAGKLDKANGLLG